MKKFSFTVLIFILFIGYAILVFAEENTERDWKSASGKSVMTGTFEKFKPSNPDYVYIRSSDGKLYQYPFAKLSSEDQGFIQSLQNEDPDLLEVVEISEQKTTKTQKSSKKIAKSRGKGNSSSKQEKPGKKYALLVGVNEYEDGVLEPLQYAVADIHLIQEKLIQLGFEPDNIKMYITGNKVGSYPNKETIEAGFHQMLEEVDENSQVFIALAGHGFALDKDSYFVVEDTKMDSDENMKATAININNTLQELNQCKAASKWFIVDACREYIFRNRSVRKSNISRGINSGLSGNLPKGVFFLQSCKDGELSYEDDGHGLFTRCFADALDGKADTNKDGNMTVLEVFSYVSTTVEKNARNNLGKKQTPTFMTLENTPDFPIASTADLLQYGLPNKDWEKIQKLYDESVELLYNKKREEALAKFDTALEMMKNADEDAPLKKRITMVSTQVRESMKERQRLEEEIQKRREEEYAQKQEKAKLEQAESQNLMKRIEETEARAKAAEAAAQRAQAQLNAAVQEKRQEQTNIVREPRNVYHAPSQFVYLGRVRSVSGDNSQARAIAAQYGYRLPSPYELQQISRSDISGIPSDGWIETSDPNTVCDIIFQRLVPTSKKGAGMNLVVGCR